MDNRCAYRETPAKIELRRLEGYVAVEMEGAKMNWSWASSAPRCTTSPRVLVGEEVGGSRQSPSERIAERSEMSGVALVEQLEGAVSEDWHAVAEPRLGVLVVELVHKRAIAFHGCRCCERVMPGGGGQRELANPRFLEVVRLS